MFTAAAKAHQADCGNAQPTTYMPYARDVYEEGSLIFPAVRVQRDYRDVDDVIRMCRRRIRVPDQWYGDYLAMLGAARIGEARLKELCAQVRGGDRSTEFVEEWFDYSERRIAHVISTMPAGTIVGEGMHDPFGPAPDGIPIRVSITIDPEAGMIEADLTDNIDCLPAGVNESRTCAMNNCMTGIFNSIDPDIPHNAGTFRRVKVKLRENCVVGIPRFPHSCSVATTNVGERLVVTTQRTIADAWDGYGLAEGACGIGPGFAVVSGTDWRKQGSPYVNQKFLGSQGGPAGPEHDGWVTYGNAVTNGLMFRDSVEIDEQKYPIRIHEIRVRPDSEGAGRRRGAPGTRVTYGPKRDAMTAAYVTDGHHHPPRGTQGGGTAASSIAFKVRADGSEEELHPIAQVVLPPGELLGHLLSGGGGYGDPREREPERVREDVLARFVSFDRAREVYGVAFERDGPRRLAGGRRGGDAPPEERAMSRFPSARLDDKVVVITGASSGIGLACAEAMSEAGAKVVLVGRDQERLAQCASRCGEHHVVAVDLVDEAAAGRIVEEALGAFGAITSLLHMAGIFLPEPARGGAARGLRPAVARERPRALRAHEGGAAGARPRLVGDLRLVDRRPGRVPELGRLLRDQGSDRAADESTRGRARAGGNSRERHCPGQHPDAHERKAARGPRLRADVPGRHAVRAGRNRRGHRAARGVPRFRCGGVHPWRKHPRRRRLGGPMTPVADERWPLYTTADSLRVGTP